MNEWVLIVLVRGGLHYMKLTGGGGERYIEPDNDVPYRICSVSIAPSLMVMLNLTYFLLIYRPFFLFKYGFLEL